MCTPSFMCKFPFSGRVGLLRANWWPTLSRTRLWHAAPVVGRAYAKSTPPPQHRDRALAPRDRLPACRHPRGDARGRTRERADRRGRVRGHGGRGVPDARGASPRHAHGLPLLCEVLGQVCAQQERRSRGHATPGRDARRAARRQHRRRELPAAGRGDRRTPRAAPPAPSQSAPLEHCARRSGRRGISSTPAPGASAAVFGRQDRESARTTVGLAGRIASLSRDLAAYHQLVASTSEGRIPDFFLVGHSKSGTTALYEMLSQHPHVFVGNKEPRYFVAELHERDIPRPRETPKTLEQYKAWFARAAPDQLVGDISPDYLWSRSAAAQIAKVAPGAKIIAILREPASFLHSLHRQWLKVNVESETDFARALALEDERRHGRSMPLNTFWPQGLFYSDHVRYVEQLRRFEAHFPR